MNVTHSRIHITIQSRPELLTELVSKQNAGSNDHSSLRSIRSEQTTLEILNSNQSLTTTRRDDDTTRVMLLHGGESTLLVGTEVHNESRLSSYYRVICHLGQGVCASLKAVHQCFLYMIAFFSKKRQHAICIVSTITTYFNHDITDKFWYI